MSTLYPLDWTQLQLSATAMPESDNQAYLAVYQQQYFYLSTALYRHLQCLKQYAALQDDQATEQLLQNHPALTDVLQRICQRVAKPANSPVKLAVTFLPARFCNILAAIFALLFRPALVVLLLLVILSCHFMFWQNSAAFDANFHIQSFTEFGQFIGLLLLSFLGHELGHISACRYYNQRCGRIGFGFYFIFPAFFSDVSQVWALRSSQRIVVNLAGVYFQTIVNSLLLLCWLSNDSGISQNLLASVILLNFISMLYALNPVLHFDGYWVLSDLLNTSNLRQQMLQQAAAILKTTSWRGRLQQLNQAPWLTGYAVLTFAFTAFFLGFFIVYAQTFLHNLPQLWQTLQFKWLMADDLSSFSVLLFGLFPLVFFLLICLVLGKSVWQFTRGFYVLLR